MNIRNSFISTFENRVKSAMKARGINTVADMAKRLSKRLGRTVDSATLCKWIKTSGKSLRTDVLFALADEVDYSSRWLALGEGTPQRWVQMNDKNKELVDVFEGLSDTAKAELISYSYRLMRISGKKNRVDPYPPPPDEL
jgi:hypothetical protein